MDKDMYMILRKLKDKLYKMKFNQKVLSFLFSLF
jgi:hypothetical protein